MSLSIEGLSLSYRTHGGRSEALRDVSITVPRGKTLAILGESGSGKSTIALAIMGLLPPEAVIDGGRILFEDQDVLKLSPEAHRHLRGRRMALVFQDPFAVLNPALRVGLQIGETLVHHRGMSEADAETRAIALLEEVSISNAPAIARAYPHELSGGMRQRALIAGALAAEPDLLILDEPTTALDVTIEAQILDLLAELQARRGLTMVFITHNLGVVRRIADTAVVLYAGQVVETAPKDAIFSRPAHPYTKGLLAAIPRLSAKQRRLASIPGRLPDLRDPPPGCRFQPRCPFADAPCAAPQPLVAHAAHVVRCHRVAAITGAAWRVADEAAGTGAVATGSLSDATVVEAQDLTKTFTLTRGIAALKWEGWRPVSRPVRVHAVDGVSLTIRRGEVLGLVGESGSGKTTLGRTILRLTDPNSGSLRINGEDVTRTPQRALASMRRAAQIVFQNPDSSLNPRKTVGEIIARPLQRFEIVPPGEVAARVASLLDLVRLPGHFADRYPHQMSGGEKQRVGIARALATEPQFIVCDEPVSALDVSVQAAIVNLLGDLRDRLGVAYLLISHDISVVAHLADRIAVMYRGRIVETGTAAEVLSPPWHPYTEVLLSAVPSVDRPIENRIRLRQDTLASATPTACVFASRCPRRIGPICDEVAPPARDLSATHVIACHLEPSATPVSLPASR